MHFPNIKNFAQKIIIKKTNSQTISETLAIK